VRTGCGEERERDHLDDLGVEGKISSRHNMGAWSGLIRLRIETVGWLL
jgi:hypothetical protein